jgi:aqualysin 1
VSPAVASLSFSGAASPALDAAVEKSIGAGVTYAVAAGNDGADACAASPARVPAALTVGAARVASLRDGSMADLTWQFGNQGACVDLFAPGSSVSAATAAGDTATGTFDGTSVAAAHVAGAAALFLEQHPTASPARVADAVAGNTALVAFEGLTPRTIGRLLYTGFLAAGQGDTAPPTVAVASPSIGAPVTGTTTLSADVRDDVGIAQVAWFVDGTLVGASATAPYALSWDSRTVGNGTHALAARAFDRAGNAGEAQVAITVTNPDAAAFDASLGVPACRTVGARCASGALLDGRAGLGPEANAPNTLLLPCPDRGTSCVRAPSCADAAAGTYHVDESLDALEVRTTDGGPFAAGKVVEVTARAWSYSSFGGDMLDLWFSPDVTAPEWTYLGTLPSAGAGDRTYTYRYTLPAGALQAIRGVFRHGGDAVVCSGGAYDDHDDLAFAVGAGTADATKPFVRLDSPSEGDTVSSLTGLAATATDDSTVARVEFYADGVLVGADSVAPYAIHWDADTLPDGGHVLRARAYDGSGNFSDSQDVKVKVKDLVPPSVAVIWPAEGALVAKNVVVTADATDNRGVASVSLYRGDALLETVATEPFEAAWDTRGVPDGTYVLSRAPSMRRATRARAPA